MEYYINPGRIRKSVNFIDNIVYSCQKDLEGNDLELKMSIMLQNGNSEMRIAAGVNEDKDSRKRKPAILWIPGGGYRGVDKNLMVAEAEYLAEAGYVVASMYYRSSAQGHYPDQLIDVKTAIRFLKANAEKFEIDPDRIGVMGRSAGGHLAAMAAMNMPGYDGTEWGDYSSEVQAAYDMFGPVDIVSLMENDERDMKADPNHRWKTIEETHAGALIGGDPETMKIRARAANAEEYISEKMCPILIMHGDSDPLVPCEISKRFYQQICEAGMENQADFYLLKNGGHGTDEFFQPEIRGIVERFFDTYLKG